MKYKYIVGAGLVVVVFSVITGMLLRGQSLQAITSPAATPGIVVMNKPTPVTFTIDLSGTPSAIPTGVNLLRISSTGAQTIVATMKDDGKAGDAKAGDKIFTAVLNMNENQPATFGFQVSAAFPGQLKRLLSPVLQFAALAPTSVPVVLPPDPAPAGNATLAGIDSDGDGVRDDLQRYIIFNVPDSARYREALKQQATALQQSLLIGTTGTTQQAIDAGFAQMRAIECLDYLGVRQQNRWKEVLALMFNTKLRIQSNDAYKAKINGQIFNLLQGDERAACTFNPDALPN